MRRSLLALFLFYAPLIARGGEVSDCEAGQAAACLTEAQALSRQVIAGSGPGARVEALLARGCALDHAPACAELGYFHLLAEARLRQACEADHARGCLNLGVLHLHGLGVAADEEQAMRLYRKACSLNPSSSSSEHDLGLARRCGRLRTVYTEDSRWL